MKPMTLSQARKCRCLLLLIVMISLAGGGWLRTAIGEPASIIRSTDLDQAITLLNTARARFKTVRDYECRLIKQERVQGVLLPESVMTMQVRNKPFSIYLHFESPDDDKGMAVCYVDGKNKGMMRVRPAGIRGILDFWSIDIHDPRALKTNRHCITEAGLGNLLECTARYWEKERQLKSTIVKITDDKCGSRPCTRIETVHPDRTAGIFYGYRCVLWLDKVTHLPVGAETYDWPLDGRTGEGELLESYRYLNLQTNVDLADKVFRH